jgi:uncharacterized protein YggU (UPF0235/DUF167 family)
MVNVYAQPGARTTEVVGIYNGALKIRVNSPPIDGRTNRLLKKFLANRFDVPAKNIQLVTVENILCSRFPSGS